MKVGVLKFRLQISSFHIEGQSSLSEIVAEMHKNILSDVGMVKTYPMCFDAGKD